MSAVAAFDILRIFYGLTTKNQRMLDLKLFLDKLPEDSYVRNWIAHLVEAIYLDVKGCISTCSTEEFANTMRRIFLKVPCDNLLDKYLCGRDEAFYVNRAEEAFYIHCLYPLMKEHMMNRFAGVRDKEINFVHQTYLRNTRIKVNKPQFSSKCADDIKLAMGMFTNKRNTYDFLRWLTLDTRRASDSAFIMTSERGIEEEILRCQSRAGSKCRLLGTSWLRKEYTRLRESDMGEFRGEFEYMQKGIAAMFFGHFINARLKRAPKRKGERKIDALEPKRKKRKMY